MLRIDARRVRDHPHYPKGFPEWRVMNMSLSRGQNVASWVLQLVAAIVLFQTLFFKFTGAKESVYIFSALGLEPWGRIGSGVVELIASVLLVIPSTVTFGAILSLGVISGAIFSHLTKLGIALPAVNDRGELFALAVVVFVCSAAVLVLHRREIPLIGSRF
jgi:putative oxidoreductase